ncbi:MAG: putative Na+/H+ antiporter [Verrucomicrobia bacterium]|nr:putative Na+/H+ antiporter [Verrucomicrobiota bacterium]
MTFPLPLDLYIESAGASVWQVLGERVAQQPFNLVAFLIFACAICHMLLTGQLTGLAHRIEQRHIARIEKAGGTYVRAHDLSVKAEIFHFLGEVEVVFGLWAIVLVIAISSLYNWATAVDYLQTRDYTEPLFVIVIMVLSSTRPIVRLAYRIIEWIASFVGGGAAAWWLTLLTVGPLLGSFITEPGAMTLTAVLLAREFYSRAPSKKFAYATLGLLFTNISVGGVLTNFAAPPVLIVAEKWGWSISYVFLHFGWKAIFGIITANVLYFACFYKEMARLEKIPVPRGPVEAKIPAWITLTHLGLIAAVVWTAHYPVVFIGLFLLFLGFYQATIPHQASLNLRLPLLVGLFLAALLIHGGLQGWWIEPLMSGVAPTPLMLIAAALTTVNDNAAITYLSSLTPGFTEAMRHAVMAGAITGGGMTVMANAPNPAGQQILSPHFNTGISPLRLFLGSLVATIIMGSAFLLL